MCESLNIYGEDSFKGIIPGKSFGKWVGMPWWLSCPGQYRNRKEDLSSTERCVEEIEFDIN
jgi:hypothetical protein